MSRKVNGSPYGCDLWRSVESSMIAHVGVKDDWLVVEFRNGRTYRYRDAARCFDVLVAAPSVGKSFNLVVKGRYRYERLDEEWPAEWTTPESGVAVSEGVDVDECVDG